MIDTAYAANENINLLRPYDAVADAIVTSIRVCCICFIPPAYVALFLSKPLTPREAWETIYAQILVDNRQAMCQPLLNFLRRAIVVTTTAGLSPIVAVVPPITPLPDNILSDRCCSIIKSDFPALNNDALAVHLQQTQIAGQLGLLVTESLASRDVETARHMLEKNKPLFHYLGPVGSLCLMCYYQVPSAQHFPTFWTKIARNPKAQHLQLLQLEINCIKEDLNEPDLEFIATAPLLESSKSLMWEMTHPDAVTTGLNIFRLADQPLADALSKHGLYEMLHGDGASPFLDDAASWL